MQGLLVRTIAIVVLLTTQPSGAADEEPSRPATSPATAKTESTPPQVVSLDQVRAKYENALKTAHAQYLRDLNELKRRAMKAENLAEANAMEEQIRVAQRERPPGTQLRTRGGARVQVQANQDWQQSSVAVKKGDVLDVTARGQWIVNDRAPAETTYGPDGLRADGTADFHGQWATLLARIGAKTFLVGKGTRIVAEQDGVLEFRSNDFSLGDNRGSVTAVVVKHGN